MLSPAMAARRSAPPEKTPPLAPRLELRLPNPNMATSYP
jgi:hypothetical protein